MVEKYTTSDWKKDLLDNNNFEQSKPFNYELCLTLMEEAGKDLEKLNPFLLLRPIWEITKAFKALSTALSVGFSDITSKVEVWRGIFKDHYGDCNTIQEIIQKEVSLKIHDLNGDNNSDKGHKKKTPYYTYVSGTRTLLRLTWFLDFFGSILLYSDQHPEKDFNDCIKMAYNKALAPHHPWLVRQGASIGISMAPSKREKAMLAFHGVEVWDKNTQEKMKRWQQAVYVIWKYLNEYYTKQGFLELP